MNRRKPQAPDANTVLTTAELAAHFRVTDRTIERWDIPSVAAGRFLWAHVLEWCQSRKTARRAA